MYEKSEVWEKSFRDLVVPGNTLKERIIWLREKGYSYKRIENKLRCSKGTISYHVGEGQKRKYNVRCSLNKPGGIKKRAISSLVQSVLMFHQLKGE